MRQSRIYLTARLAALAALASVALSPEAFAQTLCEDDTCEPGYECRTGLVDCGGACEVAPDGSVSCEPAPCEAEPYVYCARAACDTDADCGDEMVCHTYEESVCPGSSACRPGEDCEEYEEDCAQSEYSQCAYPHELPCDTDSQCGDGYECVASQICWCSGSSPAEPTDPASDPPVPIGPDGTSSDPDCGCEPTGTNHCQIQEIECTSDADCPAQWSCIESPQGCWMSSDGSSGCDEPESRCYPTSEPAYPSPGPGYPGDEGDIDDEPDTDPTAPGEGSPTTGEPPDTDDDADGDNNGGGNGHHAGHPGSGHHLGLWAACSVDSAPRGTSSGSPWAMSALALGAALLLRRRR